MNDEQILLDAAYIKLRNGEPMSLIDFQRIINLIDGAPFLVNKFEEAEFAGVKSDFIMKLQNKFMKGAPQ
jgi:hypothetical protein